ncbi:hypothetical protein [Algoriphagus jejuensis]
MLDDSESITKKFYLNWGLVPVGEKELLGISLEHLQMKVGGVKLIV